MEDLIQKITEKVGITPDQAKGAIETVLSHFKDKLPSGLGDTLESFIQKGSNTASSTAENLLGGLKDKLSGLF
jgi:nucleoid DNA-binding protein